MGSCFSKKTHTTAPSPAPQISDHQQPPTAGNEQPPFKKEIFVIKHRVSHEIDRHSDQNPSATTSTGTATGTGTGTGTGAISRTPSCSKEEVDAILIQCDRISRSNSAGAQNPIRRRRYSRSKRSFDFGLNSNANSVNYDDVDGDGDVDDDDDALNHRRHRHRHRPPEIRVSSSSSKERRISISPSRSRRSSSKERRISISPGRTRSESPFGNLNPNPNRSSVAVSGNRPAKMVSVPATDKSNNSAGVEKCVELGPVKRIHVKRNVSPARTNRGAFSDEVGYRRKSLVEIDNNAARSAQSRDTKRTRKLSRDLDVVAPSYASLLLEDIHNFHTRNTSSAVTMSPSFALPECVSKACLIMEAVADLNSNASSLCSDDRWRNPNPNPNLNPNPTTIEKESSGTALAVVNGPT